jgi:transcriptional regulator with XRE-family HTH domain
MAMLNEVGQRLRHHRAALGQPVEAVARAVKVSRALLYRYEAGEIVKLDIVDRLARYYGTTTPRLGEPINLRYGVAMISSDEQALRLHESLIARLWENALSGSRAIEEIQSLIKARA